MGVLVNFCQLEELNESTSGLMLYGFYRKPPLDNVTTWSERHNLSIPADSHRASLFSA